MIGNFLYQLTGRDRANPAIETFSETKSASGAAANLTTEFTPPSDRAFIITQACVTSAAGFGFVNDDITLYQQYEGSASNNHFLHRTDYQGAGNLLESVNISFGGPGIILLPKQKIVCYASYSGAGAAILYLNVFGYSIPRGNLIHR